jgi:hypothetical protein
MKVEDPGELIFRCEKSEDGRISIACDNTLFGINFRFRPAVPHTFSENIESGVIEFVVARDTDLIINFNYSGQIGGVYDCALTNVDGFNGDTFPDQVLQFGPLPQGRTYSFLIEND